MSNGTDEQLLNKVRFVKWKDAIRAIGDYISERLDHLNETIRKHKNTCTSEIIPEIGQFKPRVGMELTLEEFERYVKLHKQLRDTMLDIRSACLKIHDEVNITLNDCMKLIDQRSPLYSKFGIPSERASDEKSSNFVLSFVILLFLSSIVILGYFSIEKDEWNAVMKFFNVYKIST